MASTPNDTVYCRHCGQANASTHTYCSRCGQPMGAAPHPLYVPKNPSGVETVIPISNPLSLWAYYLGIFSVIPCVGIPMGIAALVCGVKGLGASETLPNRAGRVHSWVGIVSGAFFAMLYSLLLAAFVCFH